MAVAVIYQLQRFVFSFHISGRGQSRDWRLELVLCHTGINTTLTHSQDGLLSPPTQHLMKCNGYFQL